MNATETVEAFIAKLNAMELDAAWALLAPDVVYHNIPMEPVHGRAMVKAVYDNIPMEGLEFINTAIAATPDGKVLTERVDRFFMKGGHKVELLVMGTFEVKDGLITHWRDYFDMAQWKAQMAPQG